MATEFMDSVEHYVTAGITQKWDSVGGGTVVVAANGPGGRPALTLGSAASSLVRKNLTAETSKTLCFLYQPNALAGSAEILSFRESATVHVDVRLITNVLRVTRNGTTLATGSTVLTNLQYYWIAFTATIGATGSYELRIDDAVEVSSGSANTQNGGTGVIDNILLGNTAARTSGNNRYCDIIINSPSGGGHTGTVAARRVTYLIPDGAGNQTDFTPSAGSNYQNVDETTADDATTTNTSSTAGHKDLFTLASLPSSAASIYAIQHITRLRKDDAGARTARQLIRTNSNDYESADITPTTTYTTYRNIREQNPNTSADWTPTNITNLEAGYKVQA